MKKALLLIAVLGLSIVARAQKVELSVHANSGVSHYIGLSAVKTSMLVENQPHDQNFTRDPYGRNYTWCYGGGLKANLAMPNNFLVGLTADYELLRGKVSINNFVRYIPPGVFTTYVLAAPYTATGSTVVASGFFNINPYIGYRLGHKSTTLDILPGMDVAIGLDSREKGKVNTTYGEQTYTSDRSLKKPKTDIRLRMGLSLNHNRVSINTSYSHGVGSDENTYQDGLPLIVRGELFRLGVGYRLY